MPNDDAKLHAELDAIKADHEARGDDIVRAPSADEGDPNPWVTEDRHAQAKDMADQFVEAHDPRANEGELKNEASQQEREEVFVDQQIAHEEVALADGPRPPGYDEAMRERHIDNMAASEEESAELNAELQSIEAEPASAAEEKWADKDEDWDAVASDYEAENPETGQEDLNDDTLDHGQEDD